MATLRQNGIDRETAEAVAKDAFAASDESDSRVARFASQLLMRARGATGREKRLKVLRSLVGRGFEPEEARRVLRLAENALMTENGVDDANAADD